MISALASAPGELSKIMFAEFQHKGKITRRLVKVQIT